MSKMTYMTNSKKIAKYISENPDAKVYKTLIFFKGEKRIVWVYKIPLKYIYPNPDNGRILSQKIKKEDELRYNLDPTNPDHQKIYIDLILSMDDRDKSFMEDLKVAKQKEPGAITPGGMAINVNRRWATAHKLNEQYPGKFETLDVFLLPEDASAKDLYVYEVEQQIAPSHKREYTSLNELLKWRQGTNRLKLDEKELKNVFNWSKAQYEAKMQVLA